MSFPRYPKYKDSGVEWLGEVPEHWDVNTLRRCAINVRTGGTPASQPPSCDLEQGYVWYTPGDFGDSLRLTTSARLIPAAAIESGEVRIFPPRSVLIVSIGATLGKVGFSEGESSANQQINAVIPNKRIDGYFLAFSLSIKVEEMRFLSNASTIGIMNQEKTKEIWLTVPPHLEQLHIAAFLDRETAKIDALVAEQQRLIELLKEKRQAVISHAVTKGLDPTVPMKPSGIEWLGDIPAHWLVTRLGYYARVENGTTPSRDNEAYWLDGNIPWLSSGEVNQYRVVEANEFITEKALCECSLRLLPKGTIIVGMIGQGKTRGTSALLEIEACINQNLAAIVPSNFLRSDYLLYIFHSMYDYLREFGRGGNQAALNCEILSALRVVIPPENEQDQISRYLGRQLLAFDNLTAEAERAIELLQERRTALISAAVTGQIDVRQLAQGVAA
jgi:type I restriction enzyme S subunit